MMNWLRHSTPYFNYTPLLSREDQADLDRSWQMRSGLTLAVLMEQAALAVSSFIFQNYPKDRYPDLLYLAGKGQNAGDAWASARQTAAEGYQVEVLDLFPEADLPSEAAANRLAYRALGGRVINYSELESKRRSLVVDGIFGTGYRHGRSMPSLCSTLNRRLSEWRKAGTVVISIDIPSGVDANTGFCDVNAIQADVTISFVSPKIGCVSAPGAGQSGKLICPRIGIPPEFVQELLGDARAYLMTADAVRELAPVRKSDGHKGSFGHAYLIAGSETYPGAALLATRACLAGACGYVHLESAQSLRSELLSTCPELLFHPQGDWQRSGAGKDYAVLVGPGLSRSRELEILLSELLVAAQCLILDADALNTVAAVPELLDLVKTRIERKLPPVLLTPHPGEFLRLAPDLAVLMSESRHEAACALAERLGAIVLLKGAATVLARPEGPCFINSTGNTVLARAGSGDLLAGLICSFAAQGLPLVDAAQAAMYLHGMAADFHAERYGERVVLSSALLESLAFAFQTCGW